jgi:hypothetical protein
MPRIARLPVTALLLALLPAGAAAQGNLPSESEPALERRTMAAPAETAPMSPDPWIMSWVGLSARTARVNLGQIDRALEPYHTTYTRLGTDDRAQVRRAFDDLLPGQRFDRYPLSAPQARAIAYLGLGAWERSDCDGGRRRDQPSRCAVVTDSMRIDAGWIRATIQSLGRDGPRRPHGEEVALVRSMNDRAGRMVLGGPGCGCREARPDAEALLASTREALAAVESSTLPAWMRLGDQRVQRIGRLSDSLERTFIRCVSGG